MGTLTDLELGWLAGILEGEGCFDYQSSNSARIRVAMTDEDTVLRTLVLCQKVTGRAHKIKCYQPKGAAPKRQEWQLAYAVAIYGKDAIKVMRLIVHLMSARRRQRIWQVINGYRPQKVVPVSVVSNVVALLKQKATS